MKIIDILNRIANGEEVRFRILCDDNIYELTDGSNLYNETQNKEAKWWIDGEWLNEEVEIIEEEKKIPEKIDVWYDPIKDTKLERHDTDTSIEILAAMCDDLKDKYNEIIDYLNKEHE